ncbi:hypothetical protein GUITHDRAFT_133999 [Guillardia theta CCMP2712]|uniref:Tudor-knot domain-containing protein n=1 Tax=Guillardia theta (strain CCMP2712) TaxID=905079 RepID=L1JVV0_GUITC|nr:hypothetical protein GUITHDRAFT_133999 [Guillardia theta CCMP2712]EKX52300.1 hypothetical protein GUITHDRAFT_133999 [Guillardia theta CCMP2712]|eukprot:XP_005839280.1 hypothetical protein GUITHDRAFT_133999 [Guillardia theta CCMP2712]
MPTSSKDKEESKLPIEEMKPAHDMTLVTAGTKCAAFDDRDGKWFSSRIVEVNEDEQTAKVHFIGWSNRFDRWVNYKDLRGYMVDCLNRLLPRDKPSQDPNPEDPAGDQEKDPVMAPWKYQFLLNGEEQESQRISTTKRNMKTNAEGKVIDKNRKNIYVCPLRDAILLEDIEGLKVSLRVQASKHSFSDWSASKLLTKWLAMNGEGKSPNKKSPKVFGCDWYDLDWTGSISSDKVIQEEAQVEKKKKKKKNNQKTDDATPEKTPESSGKKRKSVSSNSSKSPRDNKVQKTSQGEVQDAKTLLSDENVLSANKDAQETVPTDDKDLSPNKMPKEAISTDGKVLSSKKKSKSKKLESKDSGKKTNSVKSKKVSKQQQPTATADDLGVTELAAADFALAPIGSEEEANKGVKAETVTVATKSSNEDYFQLDARPRNLDRELSQPSHQTGTGPVQVDPTSQRSRVKEEVDEEGEEKEEQGKEIKKDKEMLGNAGTKEEGVDELDAAGRLQEENGDVGMEEEEEEDGGRGTKELEKAKIDEEQKPKSREECSGGGGDGKLNVLTSEKKGVLLPTFSSPFCLKPFVKLGAWDEG